MGLTYNSFDDDEDSNSYDLRQEMRPSSQAGIVTDPKNLKPSPNFFSGTTTAVQRGVRSGVGKIALSLLGSDAENKKAAQDDTLTKQLYEIDKEKGRVASDVTYDQWLDKEYSQDRKGVMNYIGENQATESDGTGAQILQGLSDYGIRGIAGGSPLGAAYVTGTSTQSYTYNKLRASGVDAGTAQKAALNDGIVDAISMAVPVYRGSGILKNIGLVTAPVAVMEGGHAVNKAILENNGYDHQAKEYQFSKENVLTGLVLGGLINRGTAYLHSRTSNNGSTGNPTPEQQQTTAEINDSVTTDLSQNISDEFSELGLHSDDIVTREKIKQNRNVAESQIMQGVPVNVPHADVSAPPIKTPLNKENLNGNARLIADRAEVSGVDPSVALTISHLETGGKFNSDAQNKKSSANGVFQVIDSSWNKLGGGNRSDVNEQIRVGLAHIKEANTYIAKKLGRDPIASEQYLGHLLGPEGAVRVLKADKDAPLIDIIRSYDKKHADAIVNNNGMTGMTAGQAISKWQQKWQKVSARYGGDGSERVSTVYDANGNNSYDVLTDIENLQDLVASNEVSGSLNAMYPQELQPRDRTSIGSQEQIDSIANNLRPELLGNSNRISDGAPIIWHDNVVESGNGRILAITKAYESGKADEYRAYVEQYAKDNNIDISGMDRPVIVRKRLSNVDRTEFAKLANQADIAAYSASERAKNDTVPDSSILKFNQDGSINLDQSTDFVRQFLQGVPDSERGSLITRDGHLNQDGKRRIDSAMIQQAYNDTNLVARLSENLNEDGKNILNALLRSAPQLKQLNDLVKQGGRHKNSIASDLAQAAQKYSDIHASGQTVRDYLDQGQLISDGLSSGARKYLQLFDENKRSTKKIGDAIQQHIDEIHNQGDPRQGSLFGDTPEQMAAMEIMQNNPDMPVGTFMQDPAGNEIEATTTASSILEQIKKDAEMADLDTAATQAAISCALQFGEA